MKYKSLANTKEFPEGVGVAVNREMFVWDDENDTPSKQKVTSWTGESFTDGCFASSHACEIPQKKMRPMTPKECALSPHGTMFCVFDEDGKFRRICSIIQTLTPTSCSYGYCLPANLADDIVSSPWKPLEVEE
jgi:hypothetical protein